MHGLELLLLDDERRITEELSEYLRGNSYRVHVADRPSDAMNLLNAHEVDIALVDIKLPEYSGLEFIRKLKENYPDVETIVMSGHGDMESVIEAFRLGAFDYLRKPFSVHELQAAISRTKRFLEAQRKAQRFEEMYSELSREIAGNSILIGDTQAIITIRRQILIAAENSNSPVLITGESGTGKELAAREIHEASARNKGRFIAVNCAAIPREMFESEFFGHEKGAFTDARVNRKGLFRSADCGTLFLDEVGELPQDLQAKLLRTVETGTLRPVGSDSEYKANVRVICATNRDLHSEVQKGCFRSDLYYRLAVLEIHMPPLRERSEDVPILANHFLAHFLSGTSASEACFSPGLIEKMKKNSYPGNVRELKNLVERAAIHARHTGCLNIESIPGIQQDNSSLNLTKIIPTFNLATIENETVRNALQHTSGNRSKAAELLGITRQALDRRIEKYAVIL